MVDVQKYELLDTLLEHLLQKLAQAERDTAALSVSKDELTRTYQHNLDSQRAVFESEIRGLREENGQLQGRIGSLSGDTQRLATRVTDLEGTLEHELQRKGQIEGQYQTEVALRKQAEAENIALRQTLDEAKDTYSELEASFTQEQSSHALLEEVLTEFAQAFMIQPSENTIETVNAIKLKWIDYARKVIAERTEDGDKIGELEATAKRLSEDISNLRKLQASSTEQYDLLLKDSDQLRQKLNLLKVELHLENETDESLIMELLRIHNFYLDYIVNATNIPEQGSVKHLIPMRYEFLDEKSDPFYKRWADSLSRVIARGDRREANVTGNSSVDTREVDVQIDPLKDSSLKDSFSTILPLYRRCYDWISSHKVVVGLSVIMLSTALYVHHAYNKDNQLLSSFLGKKEEVDIQCTPLKDTVSIKNCELFCRKAIQKCFYNGCEFYIPQGLNMTGEHK